MIILSNIAFDCAEPARVASFWRAALGYRDPEAPPEEVAASLQEHPEWAHLAVVDEDDHRHPRLFLQTVPEPKVAPNRVRPVVSGADATVLANLGATAVEGGLLADVEGNEFRVVDGARGDGARFSAIEIDALDPQGQAECWAEMLGFNLAGTSCHPPPDWLARVAWFPSFTFVPATAPKERKNRLHFDFACRPVGVDHDRLLAMGARDLVRHEGKSFVTMQDLEGNEFDLGV